VLARILVSLIAAFIVTISLDSCGRVNEGIEPIDLTVHRSVWVDVHWGDPQVEPFVIYTTPKVTSEIAKGDSNHASALLLKLEVNFGDGAGWTDATAWYNANDGTRIKHSYSAAGTYECNARATYWDGEIVYLGSYGHPPSTRAIEVPWPFDSVWSDTGAG
jgi:hypothetical protein